MVILLATLNMLMDKQDLNLLNNNNNYRELNCQLALSLELTLIFSLESYLLVI